MRPRPGLMNLVRRLKQVVLPAPLGPINAWMVPRATRRVTPLTATKPANSLVRSWVSRMKSSLTRHRPVSATVLVSRPGAPSDQKIQRSGRSLVQQQSEQNLIRRNDQQSILCRATCAGARLHIAAAVVAVRHANCADFERPSSIFPALLCNGKVAARDPDSIADV